MQRSALAAGGLCGLPLANLAASTKISLEDRPNPTAITKLSSSISGRVITPESSEYESARLVFNRAFDQHPALIVRCANATDIGHALEFAQSNSLPLAIRGGGHSRAGFSICDGGIVIDLSGLKGVEVDPVKRFATARAGVLAGENGCRDSEAWSGHSDGWLSYRGYCGSYIGRP